VNPAAANLEVRLFRSLASEGFAEEEFRLSIGTRDTSFGASVVSADCVAASPTGLSRAVATLRQLMTFMPSQRRKPKDVPFLPLLVLQDKPRFAYRSILVDTVSNFQPLRDLFRLIDNMENAKLNVLKLRLSGHSGFRVRLDSWPRLARDGEPSYSCVDIRALREFASSRGIQLVPKFELSRVSYLLQVYPELGSTRLDGPRSRAFLSDLLTWSKVDPCCSYVWFFFLNRKKKKRLALALLKLTLAPLGVRKEVLWSERLARIKKLLRHLRRLLRVCTWN
jgi:hypothetical protein